ncbi:MAG: hypothetical protein ACRDGA_04090 [Bacteroidota bacterium]
MSDSLSQQLKTVSVVVEPSATDLSASHTTVLDTLASLTQQSKCGQDLPARTRSGQAS